MISKGTVDTIDLDTVTVSPLAAIMPDELRNLVLLQSKECLTYEEASLILSVSKRQVQYWVGQGVLSCVLLPGSQRLRRITRAQIKAFICSAEFAAGFRAPKAEKVRGDQE